MTTRIQPDSYLRRVLLAAGLTLAGLVLVLLLSPRTDPEREWYEHTGVEGPTLILQQLDVEPDLDPATTVAEREMPEATQGVAPPITEDIVAEDPLLPLPAPDDALVDGDPDRLERVDPEVAERVVEGDLAEMHRAAQQSDQFVLLFAVPPEYPEGARAEERRRQVVVRVNLYVTAEGRVDYAYVDRNDGGPLFEAAVLEAVRQWVYRPLVIDGEATEFWDRIYFVFHTEDGSVTLDPGIGRN